MAVLFATLHCDRSTSHTINLHVSCSRTMPHHSLCACKVRKQKDGFAALTKTDDSRKQAASPVGNYRLSSLLMAFSGSLATLPSCRAGPGGRDPCPAVEHQRRPGRPPEQKREASRLPLITGALAASAFSRARSGTAVRRMSRTSRARVDSRSLELHQGAAGSGQRPAAGSGPSVV